MTGLLALIDRLGKGTVRIRGEDVAIRALTDLESGALDRIWPRPLPPVNLRPMGAGSLAPLVENENDPEYKRAFTAWSRQRCSLEVAIATDSAKVMGDDAATKAAVGDAAATISAGFTEAEIHRAWSAVRNIFDESSQKRALDALAVDASELPAEAFTKELTIPENFATTSAYRWLRACERFGAWPWALADLAPGWQVLLMMYDTVRMAEEAKA